MIKLQDFARQQGVTDRAIQKHLKTYAEELDGLFQRKGPNGTWLTEEACEILRSKMKQAPVTVFEPDERVNELMKRVKVLEERLERKEVLLTASQETAQKAQDRVLELQGAADRVKLLEGAQKALEGERDIYKAEADAKTLALRQAETEKAAWKKYAEDLQQYHDDVAARKKRPFWKKGDKPVPPAAPVLQEDEIYGHRDE